MNYVDHAKIFRMRAECEPDLRVRAAFEELAMHYETLANAPFRRQRPAQPSVPVRSTPADFELRLIEWFSGDQAAYILSADLIILLRDAMGYAVPPNQYGRTMISLGFVSKQERRGTREVCRMWRRGAPNGPQYKLQRGADGRLAPVLPEPPPPPLLLPPLPY